MYHCCFEEKTMETKFRQFQTIISIAFLLVFGIQLLCFGEENAKIHPYAAAFNELMHLSVNPTKVAKVSSYIIQRDEATFVLSEGELFLCNPVLGEGCAALFIGQGTFAFTPPTIVEQKQLARFYEKKSVYEKFTMLFMLFSDSTYNELQSNLTFESNEETKKADHEIKKCLKYLSDDDGSYFNSDILRTLFEHDHSGLFYAHITDKPGMAFMVNPYAQEEIQFRMTKNDIFQTIIQYPRIQSITQQVPKEMLDVTGYVLDCTIQNTHDLDISGVGTIAFTVNGENPKWLKFSLYSSLQADSVRWRNGKQLIHWSKEKNPYLWIKLDTVLHRGDICSLQVAYHGTVLDKNQDLGWIGLKSADEWFPQYGTSMSATFDITYHYPSRYKLASIGTCVSLDTKDEVTTSRWVEPTPIHYASFNLGEFEEVVLKNDSIPEVELLYSKTGKAALTELFSQYMILSAGDMEPRIAEEVQQSAKLFQSIFGEYPFKKMYVTQVPYSHGISFPGLIHLSWTAFQFNNRDLSLNTKEGWAEVFCAHEVAHQWLGNGVDVESYHDAWLSEAIANYCGLLFMQQALKDNSKFFGMLKEWKDEILTNRKFIFGSGQQAGPVWLGYRTESSETGGDYNLIIYKKGAWILHMLRNMLLDLKTMKEDRFNEILKDFYTTYKGKKASTEDFKKIIEKHVGGLMDWFFDEWVYDTGIPKYTFAYKTEKTEDGKFKVSCKVQTDDVGENFQMVVPLYVDFGNGKFVRLRAIVKGHSTQFDLPLLPFEPEKITFNDLESVLCEVNNTEWDAIK